MGHSSVTTTEIYAKFNLRRLEMDFPSLVNNGGKPEISKGGHDIGGQTSNAIPLITIINGVE